MIAVTGATGAVGGRVARLLAGRGLGQRLVVRSAERAPQLAGAEVAEVPGGFRDRDGLERAFAGADVVLLVPGEEAPDRVQQHKTAIDAAVAAGAGHVVYLSFLGAAADATFLLARDHWATEQHLRATAPRWTFARMGLYADFVPLLADATGAIKGPAGDGRVSVVGRVDVAEALAAILAAPGEHAGATYELTGPAALPFAELARIASEATGGSLRYVPETLEQARASRAGQGADWEVDAWISTYAAAAAGELEQLGDGVQRLTGHPPRDLATVLTLTD